jgi:hypothetical protein
MFSNEPVSQGSEAAPETSASCGTNCAKEEATKQTESATSTWCSCGGCAHPAGGPVKCLGHLRKGLGMAAVALGAVVVVKTAVVRSRSV